MTQIVTASPYRRLVPAEPQTFASDVDRARLTKAAMIAFRNIAHVWKLTANESSALLAVSPSTWERMRKPDFHGILNQDQLTRVSAIVGILKGLRLLFADDLSDRWPKLSNKGPLFAGETPVACMIDGGIPRMLEVRRHVDALRGGL